MKRPSLAYLVMLANRRVLEDEKLTVVKIDPAGP